MAKVARPRFDLPHDLQRRLDSKIERMAAMVNGCVVPEDVVMAAVHFLCTMEPIAALQVLRDYLTRDLDPTWVNSLKSAAAPASA